MRHEDWQVRISGYLDGELSPEECRALEREVERDPQLARELEEMRAMREMTGSLKLREFPDQVWARYWQSTYNRIERRVGWIFLSLGSIVLLAAGLFRLAMALLSDSGEPWWIRAAVGAVCGGLAILFVSVVRERLFMRRHDPYREVRR